MVEYTLSTLLPNYTAAKAVIKFLDNKIVSDIFAISGQTHDYMQNSKNDDWTNPDEWIGERLNGKAQELARELWEDSEGVANPRYVLRSTLFAVRLGLLLQRREYSITEAGNKFINGDEEVIKTADSREGAQFILDKIRKHQPCDKENILEAWGTFTRDANARYIQQINIEPSLATRLDNLAQRGLIKQSRNSYSTTNEGNAYLQSIGKYRNVEKDKILEQVGKLRDSLNDKLLANIRGIEQENFKYFIVDLLQRMGYENVDVTGYSGGVGVDVTAKKMEGPTEINYAVEVNLQKDDIQEGSIDQFAGAMGRKNKADVGLFITTSKFSDGAKKAAKTLREESRKIITLIDGDGLIELIREHNIGIEKETIELYDIDSAYFQQQFKEEAETQTQQLQQMQQP